MKAIRVHKPGDAAQLVLDEVDEPAVAANQVLVEVEAAGVNFIDIYHRTGLYDVGLPFIPGVEGSGRIAQVGPSAGDWKIGDRVAWASGLGSYAEKASLRVEDIVAVPDDISGEVAAATVLQGLTAHYLARDTFPIGPGHSCLVHAGAGGVGLLLTQIAKILGASVTTTVGTEAKAELSRSAGADHVVLYREVDFAKAIEDLLGPKPFDVVYDGVGASTFMGSLDLLKPRGMMVSFGNASGPVPEIAPLLLAGKGSLFLTRPTLRDYTASPQELRQRTDEIFSWLSGGQLTVEISDVFDLAEAGDAHRALEGRRTAGKVLLRP